MGGNILSKCFQWKIYIKKNGKAATGRPSPHQKEGDLSSFSCGFPVLGKFPQKGDNRVESTEIEVDAPIPLNALAALGIL